MSIDPQWLARYVSDLGGDVQYDTPNFRFELPLSEVRRVIPEINKLGLACDRVSERQGRDVNGRACSIATIKVSHAHLSKGLKP